MELVVDAEEIDDDLVFVGAIVREALGDMLGVREEVEAIATFNRYVNMTAFLFVLKIRNGGKRGRKKVGGAQVYLRKRVTQVDLTYFNNAEQFPPSLELACQPPMIGRAHP